VLQVAAITAEVSSSAQSRAAQCNVNGRSSEVELMSYLGARHVNRSVCFESVAIKKPLQLALGAGNTPL